MRMEAIAIGKNPPDDVNVIVEVPVGSQPIKYELNKDAGVLVVDRFLHTPMAYPGNYGFVPHTLCVGEPGALRRRRAAGLSDLSGGLLDTRRVVGTGRRTRQSACRE